MYDEYEKFVNENKDFLEDFKINKNYNAILEHVTKEQGHEYISCIEKLITESFQEITVENINHYIMLNDKYGNPIKYLFTIKNNNITCSPTSLRYVYHSLIILKHIKFTNLTKIVEVGCGYGGLFLAINHFSKILEIPIEKYYLIDLPVICKLINSYLEKQRDININYILKSSMLHGKDVDDDNLFFISNYCFTEINKEHRDSYICNLFHKVKNGFITWQTVFGLPLTNVTIIGKEISKIDEESPQTAPLVKKNYFVYF